MNWKHKELHTSLDPRRDDESQEEFVARVERESLAKLWLLFEEFGVPPSDPKQLVWALAHKHYSGFRLRRSGVKAQQRKLANDLILMAGVYLRNSTMNVSQAIRGLKKHNGWRESVSTLRRRYYDLQKGRPRRRIGEAAAALLPDVIAHFQKK
jgi:hypothetical protein